MTTEMKFKNTSGYTNKKYEAWLLVDGTPVAFLHLLEKEEYEGYVCVCTIETREGYRGKGYATMLMAMAAEKLGQTLATSGSFTPEGFAALNGKLPLLPHYSEPTKPSFESMTFVRDWDNMRKFK